MPPRLPARCSAQLVICLDNALIQSQRTVNAAGRPSWPSSQRQSLPNATAHSSFSTTAPRARTRAQKQFHAWLRRGGKAFRKHDTVGPNYLPRFGQTQSNHTLPFPQNPAFISEPVLSPAARKTIYSDVMEKGLPLKAVSARYSVDTRRVAAIIRLEQVERAWVKEGKELAKPYSKAVTSMLPLHNLEPDAEPFEPINDIHVHSFTQQQLFVPTSESCEFTRHDAAKAFGDRILPPERKMRIPELLSFEKDIAAGMNPADARAKFLADVAKSELSIARGRKLIEDLAEKNKTRVQSGRYEFRFENFSVNSAGRNGRSRAAVGWRYGVPFNDRKKGLSKIPTKVE